MLDNKVDIDETYISGKNKNRHSNKKVANSQGQSTKDKVAVLGIFRNKGSVIAKSNVKAF